MLRQSVRKDFDQAILERSKSGFELPLETWCQQELQGQIMDLFSDRSTCEAVGLDQAVVMRLWTAFTQNAPGLYWSRIWAVFVLLWWAKRYKAAL
jgi:asparagine synthase (glutamine-hydrolysing)